MARPLLCVCVLAGLAGPVRGQSADTLRAEDGWRRSATATLAATQAAYANWQEGGVNALAATAAAEGGFDRVVGRVLVQQDARAAFGVLRQDSLAVRKSEDEVRYAVTAELRNAGIVHPTLSLTAQSQFAPGFDAAAKAADYPTLPIPADRTLKVSDAFAPAFFTQTVGVTVRPRPWASLRAGVGLKETVVTIRRLRPVYGNAPGELVRIQAGVEGEAKAEREVAPNVLLKSRLLAFQAFNQIGNEAPDVRLNLSLVMKVNGALSVSVDTTTLFDADVSERVQFKEALSVGLSFIVL